MMSWAGITQTIRQLRVGELTAAVTIVVAAATLISSLISSYSQEYIETLKYKGTTVQNVFYQNPVANYTNNPTARIPEIQMEIGYLIKSGALPDEDGEICKSFGLGPPTCETDKPGFIRRTLRTIRSLFR
jgi:hypothetical protein